MIRLIHNLGGCGGTLLSRCLGVLPGVAIFSEINPGSVKLFDHFDPLYQDKSWVHLLTDEDRDCFASMDLTVRESFVNLIAVFHQRAGQSGRHLILRDFNYLDFVGVPFLSSPPAKLMIYNALPAGIPLKSIAFIRHPIDQWVSLCKHVELTEHLSPVLFCDAYLSFLQNLNGTRIYRYEDFVAHPEDILRDICADLDLPFASAFMDEFHTFDSITGDFMRLRDTSISLPEKKAISASAMNEFTASLSFKKVLEATGYEVSWGAVGCRNRRKNLESTET